MLGIPPAASLRREEKFRDGPESLTRFLRRSCFPARLKRIKAIGERRPEARRYFAGPGEWHGIDGTKASLALRFSAPLPRCHMNTQSFAPEGTTRK